MTTISFARLMVTAVILFSPAVALAEAPSSQLAQNTVASSPAGDAGSKAAPSAAADKKICKELPSSYSRMTQRVCLTDKEWQKVEEESKD